MLCCPGGMSQSNGDDPAPDGLPRPREGRAASGTKQFATVMARPENGVSATLLPRA
jgi:hypothetical protein